MSKSIDEIMKELEEEARKRMGKPSSEETVYAADETVPERGADETVFESAADETVYDEAIGEKSPTVPRSAGNQIKPSPEISENSLVRGSLLLNTYRIDSDPIHGGMGSVWRVHHTNWNADLAMKRPQAKLFQSEKQKEAFIHECESWINLGLHPNIVSCYYVREIDGVPTIFSEWMENGSLKNRIQDGSLYAGSEKEQQERLLDIAIQFAGGLHYAHEQGLIHQDVKPDNLLLSKEWDAKVADFGLAGARAQLTVLEGENTLADSGATIITPSGGYTPAYCSMEQMDGKALTRRTDIYSWAVSVMEMYMGERMWDNGVVAGLSCESYYADCRVPMPEALQELLKKCMESEPENRPHDFGEIESELKKIYGDVIDRKYPRPEPKAAADTADSLNNRALSYLDLGLQRQAEMYWLRAIEKNPEHTAAVYNHSLQLWRNGKIETAELDRRCENVFRKDEAAAERLKPLLLREEEEAKEKLLYDVYDDPVNRGDANEYRHIAVSPDGERIYVLFDALYCHDSRTFEKLYEKNKDIFSHLKKPYPEFLLLTQDGKYLVFAIGYETDIWVAEAASGQIKRILKGHRSTIIAGCLHPTENFLYTSSEDRTIRKWNIETGECIQIYNTLGVKGTMGWFKSICVSPENGKLYASATANGVAVWDELTGERLKAFSTEDSLGDITASPDGKFIYGREYAISTADGTLSREEALSGNKCLWLSSDGKKLFAADQNRVITLWDTERRQCIQAFHMHQRSRFHINRIADLSVSRDLSVVAAADTNKSVCIWYPDEMRCYAPWELSVIRSYNAQISEQLDIETRIKTVEKEILSGNILRAIEQLEQAEESFPLHLFQEQRRKLAKFCASGKLKDVYEVSSFAVAEDTENPWARSQAPAADPRGGIFATVQPGNIKRNNCLYVFTETGERLGCIAVEAEYSVGERPVYSPSGELLAVVSYDSVSIYDTDGMKLHSILKDFPHAIDEGVVAVVFSPDGQSLLVGTGDGYLGLWDVETGKESLKFERGSAGYQAVCFLEAGAKAAAVDRYRNLKLFETEGGKLLKTIEIDWPVESMSKSPDEAELYLCPLWGEDPVCAVDTKTWKIKVQFNPEIGNYNHIAISHDGSILAVSGEKGISLLSLPGGEQIWSLPELKKAELAFSPDDCLLCAGIGINMHMLMLRREFVQ